MMADIYPPVRQREALLTFRDALGCRDNALRRDECGDWRIEGRSGHIYAVPGSLDRPKTPGFQIFIARSSRWWTNAKAALKSFAEIANDGDGEGNLPREHGFIAMGIDWPMTTAEISEAIPPAYSRFVAEAFLAWAKKEQA